MNRALASEILAFLRVSGAEVSRLPRLRRFSLGDWERTLEWLHSSGLALRFWTTLRDLGAERVVPPEISARLARNFADNSHRVARMATEFDSLNRRFAEAGIPYAVLKGFAQIPDYCPHPNLRHSSDHDYLIPVESLAAAHRVLEAAGWVRKKIKVDHSVTYCPAGYAPRFVTNLDEMYSAQLPREVDLNFKLWEEDRWRIPLQLPDDFLARARVRSLEPISFLALADEDALIFQVSHAFRHMLGYWCQLSVFYEIAYFLQNQALNMMLWSRFRERLEAQRCPLLGQSTGVIFLLATRLCGGEIPDAVRPWISQSITPAMTCWIEHYGRDSALEHFHGDKRVLFLQREFIHDPGAWRDIRRRKIFLLQRPARVAHAPDNTLSARLHAARVQWRFVSQSVRFHLPSTIRYVCEYLAWKSMLHRVSTRGTATLGCSPPCISQPPGNSKNYKSPTPW